MATPISWSFVSWIICSTQLIIDSWNNSSLQLIIVSLFSLPSPLSPGPVVPLRWLLSSRLHSAYPLSPGPVVPFSWSLFLDHESHCLPETQAPVSCPWSSRLVTCVSWSLSHKFLIPSAVSSAPYSSQLTVYIIMPGSHLLIIVSLTAALFQLIIANQWDPCKKWML
jgi:hypothetical protein